DGRSFVREIAILEVGFLTTALGHPAVQQNPFAAGFQQVHRAGDGPGRTPEREFHSAAGLRASRFSMVTLVYRLATTYDSTRDVSYVRPDPAGSLIARPRREARLRHDAR